MRWLRHSRFFWAEKDGRMGSNKVETGGLRGNGGGVILWTTALLVETARAGSSHVRDAWETVW